MSDTDETKVLGEDKKTSGQDKGDTSGKDKTGTFTEEQEKEVSARVEKAKSDALAKAGRSAKAITAKETGLQAREDALKKREDDDLRKAAERRQREREAGKDDPDALPIIEQKHANELEREAIRKERDALDAEKVEHAALVESAAEAKREILIWDIANEDDIKIDPVQLKKFADELELKTEEQIRAAAKQLAEGKSPDGDGDKKPGDKGFKKTPDSGETEGGELSDEEKLKLRFPTMS